MTEKLRLVDGDVLDADAAFVAADVDNAVNHDERIAMRQQPQNLADLDGFNAFAVHRPLPGEFWRAAKPCTR